MGMTIDEDRDERRRTVVARLIGQSGWEASQPMIHTTGPAPLAALHPKSGSTDGPAWPAYEAGEIVGADKLDGDFSDSVTRALERAKAEKRKRSALELAAWCAAAVMLAGIGGAAVLVGAALWVAL